MLRPFRHIRSRFVGLTHRLLAVSTVIGLVCWLGASLANQGPGFIPQLILIIDESGSMTGRHAWLMDFVPALGQALTERNKYDSPDDVEFTVAGFTDNTRKLVLHGSKIDATDAVSRLHTDRGSTEDGYVAIREVLDWRSYDYGPPTTVILISDEDRDVTDPDVSLESLAEYLAANGVVVHSVIPAQILCPGRKAGIAIDQYAVALQPDIGGLSTCENAESWIHRDYAELAWSTGGLTWDLGMLVPGSRRQASTETLAQFVAGLSDKILTQWPTTISARIDFSPSKPRPGDVVTFDGSNSFVSQPGREISNWAWDLDGDGAIEEHGAIIARMFSTGRHRIVLEVTDNSTPPATSRKVLYLEIAD